jgi:hypothetical protein
MRCAQQSGRTGYDKSCLIKAALPDIPIEHIKCGILLWKGASNTVAPDVTWFIHTATAPAYFQRGCNVSLMQPHDGNSRTGKSWLVFAVGEWLECRALTLHDFQDNMQVHNLSLEDLRAIAGVKTKMPIETLLASHPFCRWMVRNIRVVPRLVVPATPGSNVAISQRSRMAITLKGMAFDRPEMVTQTSAVAKQFGRCLSDPQLAHPMTHPNH